MRQRFKGILKNKSMASRKKHSLTEEEKALRRFHKVSSRHVLVLETDLKHHEKCKVFHYAD